MGGEEELVLYHSYFVPAQIPPPTTAHFFSWGKRKWDFFGWVYSRKKLGWLYSLFSLSLFSSLLSLSLSLWRDGERCSPLVQAAPTFMNPPPPCTHVPVVCLSKNRPNQEILITWILVTWAPVAYLQNDEVYSTEEAKMSICRPECTYYCTYTCATLSLVHVGTC